MFGVMMALAPARAFGQTSSSLHAGSVEMSDPTEQTLFGSLLCQCGDCRAASLSTCTCSTADARAAKFALKLRGGRVDRHHPSRLRERVRSRGAQRSAQQRWAASHLPGAVGVALGGLGLVFTLVRRWKKKGDDSAPPPRTPGGPVERDEYDNKLDEELKKLDDDRPR